MNLLAFNFRSVIRRVRRHAAIDKFNKNQEFMCVIHYRNNYHNELTLLCDKYGSDKGSSIGKSPFYSFEPHTYSFFYNELFGHFREGIRKVFECGIGTNNPNLASNMGINGQPGASLRVWRDYFPNAQVFGGDIDKDILFVEERIKTFHLDQRSPKSITNFWLEVNERDFDLMVDDGLHTFEAGSMLFTQSIDRLGPRGFYVIEDVSPKDLLKYQKFFHNKEFYVRYVNLFRPHVDLALNSLIVITKQV